MIVPIGAQTVFAGLVYPQRCEVKNSIVALIRDALHLHQSAQEARHEQVLNMNVINTRREFLAGSLVVAAGSADAGPNDGIGAAQLRVARATDDLSAVVDFYRDGLGLEVIYEFKDHEGFDGVMLGRPGSPYHLEFTRNSAHRAAGVPGPENLLVFYLPDAVAYRAATARMQAHGHQVVRAFNPYWDKDGRTYEDPDGYRVVLQNAAWPPVANISNGSLP